MLNQVRQKLTYANVVATGALFIALGGSSYAALTLPRNSVGSNQIRASAVGTSEIRNRSVALTDISLGARRVLRGATGPQGPAGPAGPAATKYFAVANAAGGFIRGNASSGGRAGAVGTYTVSFPGPITSCATVASLGTTDGTALPAGRITTSEQGGAVAVHTYDQTGNPSDLPFQIVVAC